MANKREFKKYVEAIGASACDAMMATYFDKGVKAFDSLEDYCKAKKEFYSKMFVKINDDFAKEIDEALKVFNGAIPQAVKDSYKKAVTAE